MSIESTIFGKGRQAGGHRAKAAGKAFEQLILLSQIDAKGRVCQLERIGNFARRIGGEKMVEEKSPWDLCGTVYGTGRGIFIEAKSLGAKMNSFRVNDPKIVKLHQLSALADQERAGAIAGFVVRCERTNDYRWIAAIVAYRFSCRPEPIRMDDPNWFILGPINGRAIPLRKLCEAL